MKRFLALTFALLLLSSNAYAAVARDTVTSGQKSGVGTTLTVSHTVTTSGANRAIYVLCALDDNVITLTATYAGAAMTLVRPGDQHASQLISSWIFRKLDPATGANDWVVTQSSGDAMICWALSATSVNQTTPETDTDGTCPAAGTSSTLTLTTATGELLLDILAHGSTTSTDLLIGANQTQEMLLEQGTAVEAGGSRQAGADGGVMSWSWTTSQNFCYSAVSIGAAPSTRPIAPVFFP